MKIEKTKSEPTKSDTLNAMLTKLKSGESLRLTTAREGYSAASAANYICKKNGNRARCRVDGNDLLVSFVKK